MSVICADAGWESMTSPVGVLKSSSVGYPGNPPYHPPGGCPELAPFAGIDNDNTVYAAVRDLFLLMGFDKERYGTANWNPLGWLVRPGETVFIKPNMIAHRDILSGESDHVVTHGSVIRPVIDYVYLALNGRGRILVGDSPQEDSSWRNILEVMGLVEIQEYYLRQHGFSIDLLDLRDLHRKNERGIYSRTTKAKGDPLGSLVVNLGSDSEFAELDGRPTKYYGAYYDTDETNDHHCRGKHEYAIAKSPIAADVFIGIPKLKTHKKCGLTVSLKGLVGINAVKNWLPHYTFGSPATGGDQFSSDTVKSRLENQVVLTFKNFLKKEGSIVSHFARSTKGLGYWLFGETDRVVRSGNWHGNDTVWRMALDLNRILLYANVDGSMRRQGPPKRYFSVVDGIIGMEGDGPVAGTRKEAGVLLAGTNAVAVDAVCARLIGFNYTRLPIIARAFGPHAFPLIGDRYDEITALSNHPSWNKPLVEWQLSDVYQFRPHFGWEGIVELHDSLHAGIKS